MAGSELQRAVERHADHLSRRIAEAAIAYSADVGTVASVTGGAAQDGLAVVTVTVRGSETTVAGYATSYTPAVGDRVVCVPVRSQWFIAFAIGGAP